LFRTSDCLSRVLSPGYVIHLRSYFFLKKLTAKKLRTACWKSEKIVHTTNINNCVYFNKIGTEEYINNICAKISLKTVADGEPVAAIYVLYI